MVRPEHLVFRKSLARRHPVLRAYPKTSECVIEPVCFVWMEQNNGSQTHSSNNMAYPRRFVEEDQ
ncbi:MAG TPA: hypothetical protein VK619_13160, partial [Pyrinomonadaceae bacterium]|nr:hypothetical protein [Pyrinomonadaceae bacterium]